MVFTASSRHKPAQTWETQKSVQRSSKVPWCSPIRQTSIWTRPAAESDRNYISRPRTTNSFISRNRSNVSSSCCPKQWQPMLTISLARRSRAENRSLWVYTTRFWGKNYALYQVTKDNAVNDESLVRTVQRKFYLDDFLKSVRTPQEAIEIYQKVRDIFIKGGFNLAEWITSDDEVKSQIPETDRWTNVVKAFEAERQSSSILGLNWNVDTDSLIVCRGTEQEVPAKITQRIVLSLSQQCSTHLGYLYPSPHESGFYSKASRQKWVNHGTRSCQSKTQNYSVIGALSWEK